MKYIGVVLMLIFVLTLTGCGSNLIAKIDNAEVVDKTKNCNRFLPNCQLTVKENGEELKVYINPNVYHMVKVGSFLSGDIYSNGSMENIGFPKINNKKGEQD